MSFDDPSLVINPPKLLKRNLGYRVLENEGTLIHRLELERAIGPILPSGVAPMTICASFAAHAYPRIHRKIKDRLSDHLASDSIP